MKLLLFVKKTQTQNNKQTESFYFFFSNFWWPFFFEGGKTIFFFSCQSVWKQKEKEDLNLKPCGCRIFSFMEKKKKVRLLLPVVRVIKTTFTGKKNTKPPKNPNKPKQNNLAMSVFMSVLKLSDN